MPPTLSAHAETLDGWLTRRVRAAYATVTEHRVTDEGLPGLVRELAWALENLSDARRKEGDRVFFETAFFGRLSVGLIRALGRAAPNATAETLARLTPHALRFLVGEAHYAGPSGDVLPSCDFRRMGGEVMCQRVCREPTETFCRDRLGVPLRLSPEPSSLACTWRWGQGGDAGADRT
jgi:hypothetical protein